MPGKQVVDLPLAGAVAGGQPFQGVRLIRGVVVDVCLRMVGEPRGRPVDKPLESALLRWPVMCPERMEELLGAVPGTGRGHGPEQVLQTSIAQRVWVALHVEVDVTGVLGGQGGEPVRGDHPDGHGPGPVVIGAGGILDGL